MAGTVTPVSACSKVINSGAAAKFAVIVLFGETPAAVIVKTDFTISRLPTFADSAFRVNWVSPLPDDGSNTTCPFDIAIIIKH